MTPLHSPAQSPAERILLTLPHLGERFTFHDAAARLRVLDPCGWPVPIHGDKLAWQLSDLALAGRIDSNGEHFSVPARELLALADQGLPEHPVADITDWTVDIREALSRSAAALTLLAHRLRRSLPQDYPAGSVMASAAGHVVGSPDFIDLVAAQPEPLDPAFLLAAATRTVAGLWDLSFSTRLDLSPGQIAVCRLLGWDGDLPELAPVRQALSRDSSTLPTPEYAALLNRTDPHQWISDDSGLSTSGLHLYPEFAIRRHTVLAESPVRALGRYYLYVFEASQFAGSRAASDPLLAEYEPQAIGGGLMGTRRDATPLFRSLGIDVRIEHPSPSLNTRIEIARTATELAKYFTGHETRILAEAVHLGTAVEIVYRSESGEETRRVVSNPSLTNKTLLRGHCHLRGEERMFRLDRISEVMEACTT